MGLRLAAWAPTLTTEREFAGSFVLLCIARHLWETLEGARQRILPQIQTPSPRPTAATATARFVL